MPNHCSFVATAPRRLQRPWNHPPPHRRRHGRYHLRRYVSLTLTPSCLSLNSTSPVATYPLDIVRTRLSIQSASFATLGKPNTKLPGMFTTMKLMYRTEGGIISLYRGLGPTLAGVAPYVGINFATYEAMRKFMTPDGQENPSALGKLTAGAVSGAVAQSVTYPFEYAPPPPPRWVGWRRDKMLMRE